MSEDLLDAVQFAVVLGGLAAMIYPALWAFHFQRDRRGVGLRLAFMLFGEAINMAAMVYFAINSLMHTYNQLNPWQSISLRVVIITVTLWSTIKLVQYHREITKRAEEADG